MPNDHQHLPGNGYPYFHLILFVHCDLNITEFIKEASLCPACRPGTFYQCFSEIFISMRYPA
jgi:hypothetical protein